MVLLHVLTCFEDKIEVSIDLARLGRCDVPDDEMSAVDEFSPGYTDICGSYDL